MASKVTGIFGFYRWVLAICVVLSHLAPPEFWYIGCFAVFSFYILSGYLMCLSYNNNYRKKVNPVKSFYINRALRIYPPYIFILILSLIFLYFFPDSERVIHPLFAIPENFNEGLRNILIFGLTDVYGVRTNSVTIVPAWSLSNELLFYLLVPLLTKNNLTHTIWLIITASSCLLVVIFTDSFLLWYFSIAGSFIAFAAGTFIYYMQQNLLFKKIFQQKFVLIFFAIITPIITIYGWENFELFRKYGLYIFLFLNFFIVAGLASLEAETNNFAYRLDKLLGDISYPIFLSHLLIGSMVITLGAGYFLQATYTLFIIGLVLTNLFALIVNYLIERNINILRNKVRNS